MEARESLCLKYLIYAWRNARVKSPKKDFSFKWGFGASLLRLLSFFERFIHLYELEINFSFAEFFFHPLLAAS